MLGVDFGPQFRPIRRRMGPLGPLWADLMLPSLRRVLLSEELVFYEDLTVLGELIALKVVALIPSRCPATVQASANPPRVALAAPKTKIIQSTAFYDDIVRYHIILQSVQQERGLDFSKTIRDFWTFFFLMKVHSKDYGAIAKAIQ